MTRLLLLESGEELGPTHVPRIRAAAAPVRLRLLEPAPPFRSGHVVHVSRPGTRPSRARDFVLTSAGGAFRLGPLGKGPESEGEEILARVVAVEQGQATVPLERGLPARVPARWLPRALDALEVLWRVRHPFTPSLYLGSAEACLAGVCAKYNSPGDVHGYAALASTGLEPIEREIVERHVKPGGRILDIGCGGGREALGFARAGFRVVAIDIAPRMIEAAKLNAEREGLGITFRVQSVTELDDPPGSFDGAFWAGSYHHVPGRVLRVETLRRIRGALTSDGVLILMVVYRGPRGLLSRARLVDLLRRAGRALGKSWRLSELGNGYIREVSEAGDPREACFFHDFSSSEEVRAEIEIGGFSAEEVAPGWWVGRLAVA